MTSYLINLAFWVVCMGLLALYWYRRIDRESRERNARRDREMNEFHARLDAQRAKWDAEDAAARAEHEALVAELDAKADRVNQYLIARGLEPVPREPPEPTEAPEPQA